jgi:hypothetical protein
MSDSAMLKVDRASEHIRELNELYREKRPFVFTVETDTQTRKRFAFIKQDEAVICRTAAISGDIVHNLRAALDHAYWEIVSPFATSPREKTKIQFPFCETAAGLEIAVKKRLGDRVSTRFFKALIDLKPHGDDGGNQLLHLIHKMDVIDKHRLLIPTCDETRLPYDQIKGALPDFPFRMGKGVTFTGCEFRWSVQTLPTDIGVAKPPTTHIFEREFPIPIEIIFSVSFPPDRYPVVPTLYRLVDLTRETIAIIRAAAQ